jgi:uncharacterized membrane protein
MTTALLSLGGLFVAVYLYLYKIGRIGTLACGTGACETVQLSPYSRFLGLEVALYGVGGYATLLVLSLVALQAPAGTATRVSRWLLGLSAAGVVFTVYLTYIELFVLHAICRWCVSSALIITAIFIVSLLERRSQG